MELRKVLILKTEPVEAIVAFIRSHPEEVRRDPELVIRAVHWNVDTTIVRALVEACPDALLAQDENGLCPLSWIGDLTKPSTDWFLLDEVERLYPPGSERRHNPLVSQDVEGNSPLHRTCQSRRTDPALVKRMLKICPQSTQIENNRGETAQDCALENWRLRTDDRENRELLPEIHAAFEDAKARATNQP